MKSFFLCSCASSYRDTRLLAFFFSRHSVSPLFFFSSLFPGCFCARFGRMTWAFSILLDSHIDWACFFSPFSLLCFSFFLGYGNRSGALRHGLVFVFSCGFFLFFSLCCFQALWCFFFSWEPRLASIKFDESDASFYSSLLGR